MNSAQRESRSETNVPAQRVTRKPGRPSVPGWLRFNEERRCYEIIPGADIAIRAIFDDAAKGIGAYKISRRLDGKFKPWGKTPSGREAKLWHASYIAKILQNRAVTGEFQSTKKSTRGKRIPVGKPEANCFPQIITDDLFKRVQQFRADRLSNGRGPKGKNVSNLFSGLATCSYCNSPMRFYTARASLVCSAARQGSGCSAVRWPYDHFEKSFLRFVEQLDLESIVRADTFDKEAIDNSIRALELDRQSKTQEMDGLLKLLKINPDFRYVARKLAPLQQQLDEIEGQLAVKILERDNLQAAESEFNKSKGEVSSLISRLQKAGHTDLYKLRSQLSARIKALINKLCVAPAGSAPIMERLIKEVSIDPDITRVEKKRTVDGIRSAEHQIFFDVEFKNGDGLRVFPHPNDPMRFLLMHTITESLSM